MVDASQYVLSPHSLVGFPVHLYVLGDTCMWYGEYSPHVRGWGIPPYVGCLGDFSTSFKLWFLAVHPLSVHDALSCTFLVVIGVSCIYHSYDYYSSCYGGVFWSVIDFISYHGPFLEWGFPATLGQHEVVLLPSMMPRCPGGVIGLASVPQQQPPSLMPLLAYANYAMDSPRVGFFFRVEPPTILYIISLVSILVSAFYFQVPSWMLYSPMGAQLLGFAPLHPFGVYPW